MKNYIVHRDVSVSVSPSSIEVTLLLAEKLTGNIIAKGTAKAGTVEAAENTANKYFRDALTKRGFSNDEIDEFGDAGEVDN